MKNKLLPLGLLLLATACQPSGSYDNHGNYHSSEKGWQGTTARRTSATDDKDAPAFNLTRPGFYDAGGNYAGDNGSFGVPPDFLPSAGACRIWQPDRSLSLQGPALPCRERYTLPRGAYLIYGG